MQILVKTLTGRTSALEVDPHESVEGLRAMLTNNNTGDMDRGRIIFQGKQLEDGRLLSDYNIIEDSTVHLVYRLYGA